MTARPSPPPSIPGTGNEGLTIPFNRPSLEGAEMDYMRQAVEQGHTSADGPFSKQAAEILRDAIGAADVLLTTSCTAALEMSAMMLDIGPGDTVVVPSFAFVTTALAYSRQGAQILFCDIDPKTLALDAECLDSLMDDTVRAVVPIHYAGIGCDLTGIAEVVAKWPRAEMVEDNAHGLFGSYHGRPLGSFGRFSALSFHETKNFICGEGGALIINDPADVDRAHVLYQKGTDRRAFLHGQVDKYSWRDTGSSFGLSDVLAAYLFGQLEQRSSIFAKRKAVYDRYQDALAPRSDEFGLTLPDVPAHCDPAYHMFYVLLPDASARTHVLSALNGDGIYATFHYVPLHDSEGGMRVAARPVECPVTEDISSRLLRLPFYTGLTESDQNKVVDAFLAAVSEL